MFWIFYALVGPFLWAICNILNKIIRTKHLDSSRIYVIFIGFAGLLSFLVIPFYGFEMPGLTTIFLGLLIGIIQSFACIIYLKTLSFEEVARVIPLFRFVAIFVLIFATIFLKETLNLYLYIAFFMLVIGGFIISLRRIEGVFRLSNAIYFIFIASMLYATAGVLLKYISGFTQFSTYFVLSRSGFFITSLVLLFVYFKKFKSALSSLNLKSLSLILVTELLGLTGGFSAYYAISIAPISLVNAVESFHPLFVFVFASLFAFKYPHLLKEELNWKTLLIKSIAILIMIGGVLLIYLKWTY